MNKQSFDLSKPNGKKYFNGLFNFLMTYNKDSDNDDYYDIHIYPSDFDYMTIEWEKTPYDKNSDWGGSFKWVDVYDEVYTEVSFPDNHYEMVPKGSEEDALKEWHKDHPEWVVGELGTWTNKDENTRWAIENNLSGWLSKRVSSDDSTFEKFINSRDDLDESTITQLMEENLDVDTLRRTDHIIIGTELLSNCYRDDNFIESKKGFGEGILHLLLRIKESWNDSEEVITNNITVYVNEECKTNILYLTENQYLIAKQEFIDTDDSV